MLQVIKGICSRSEGWRASVVPHRHHLAGSSEMHPLPARTTFVVSSAFCVGLSAPSVRIIETIFTSLLHNLLM